MTVIKDLSLCTPFFPRSIITHPMNWNIGHQLVIPEEVMENSDQWERCLVGFFSRLQVPLPCHQIHGNASLEGQWVGSHHYHNKWFHPFQVQKPGCIVKGSRARAMVVWRETLDSPAMEPKVPIWHKQNLNPTSVDSSERLAPPIVVY